MHNIYELKEQTVTDTPLLLFDCLLPGGPTEFWSTHSASVDGRSYASRVIRHNIFEIQAASDQGVDGIPRISLVLSNADSHFSQLERSVGLKGARLTVRFVFYDLRAGEPASEPRVIFQGICNPAEEILESTFRVSATNRMNMQRLLLPSVRIQRRCPWNFPADALQRQEASDGGPEGKYSRFYRCGYSASEREGLGALNGTMPFERCNYTREDCTARGMWQHFGGLEFVPSSILVRSYGDKTSHTAALQSNEARYNDFVPAVYGTVWYNPPIVFARNDGNLTRMEVLLGQGEIQGVIKVLVNEIEIPPGQAGARMAGTGWFNVPTLGTRTGGFNLDFTASDGTPAGDPYGSMAYLALVVPNRINDGGSLPRVKVLLQGLKLPTYNTEGAYAGEQFTNNAAWVLLDVLRRSGWVAGELDLASFGIAAALCDELVKAKDLNGNTVMVPRFQCNLLLQKRRSAGDVIRGIRNASRLYLTYSCDGKLQLAVEDTIARQQPTKPAASNSDQQINGGWPAYDFGDGTYGLTGILRRETGEPSVRVWARSSTDTGNRFALEFQDAFNEYQQDSLSLVDGDDVARVGQEITAPLTAFGIPNYNQASRILKFNLDKSLRGNLYVEFETSVRAIGLRPGDIISLTYLKEGFDRQLFRVLKIAPGPNFHTARIACQIHDDAWYADTNGQVTPVGGSWREGGAGVGIPRPVGPKSVDAELEPRYEIEEAIPVSRDTASTVQLVVGFSAPARPKANGPAAPLLDLTATVAGGGPLPGNVPLYYGVSAVDANGTEGRLSFVVRAVITGTDRAVNLTGLSFSRGTVSFNVYRGATPAQLYLIAANQPVGPEFHDSGAEPSSVPPPDDNFDHANFYWRSELQPPCVANIHTATTVGSNSLQMADSRYLGCVVRILSGKGVGQERSISSNTSTTLAIDPPWELLPDASSRFAVAEGGWQFGALAATSPARFEVPNRPGEVVQICGRAANVNDNECALDLSVVTRWTLGGTRVGDSDLPAAPVFGIGPGRRGGTLEVNGVAFPTLENTKTITSGTLSVYYWNELLGQTPHSLASGIGIDGTEVQLCPPGPAQPGRFLQIEAEIMQVIEVFDGGSRYRISRGAHTTDAQPHPGGASVYHLDNTTVVMPFPKEFFGSPYSGSWSYPVNLPNVRVASAELLVTNQRGNGPITSLSMTQLSDFGFRTLSGGQYTIQMEGFLAVDPHTAPPLVVDTTHAVRDVFAVLGRAADGPVEVQVNLDDESLGIVTVPTGLTVSNSLNGFSLPLFTAGARISVSVLRVGLTYPGADLTVVIRL